MHIERMIKLLNLLDEKHQQYAVRIMEELIQG